MKLLSYFWKLLKIIVYKEINQPFRSQNTYSRLLDSDVPVNCVAQLSGHQNVKSNDSYKSASIQHQQRMSFTLSRMANVRQTSASSSFLTSSLKIFIGMNQVKALLQKVISWEFSMELSSRTAHSSHQLSNY